MATTNTNRNETERTEKPEAGGKKNEGMRDESCRADVNRFDARPEGGRQSEGGREGMEMGGRRDNWDNPATEEFKEHATQFGRDVNRHLQGMYYSGGPAAREQMENVKQAVTDRAEDIEESLTCAIRERPIKSVLMAAGVGFVVGMFMARR